MYKSILLVLFLLLGASQVNAQCVLPAVTYNTNQDRITVKEKDRGAVYNITWTDANGVQIGNMTQQNSMFSSGGGQWVIGATPNTNNPSIYLLGGIQVGSTVTISKNCSGTFNLLATVVIQ